MYTAMVLHFMDNISVAKVPVPLHGHKHADIVCL